MLPTQPTQPTQPIQILLISAHPLWLQVCSYMLESLPRKIMVAPALVTREAGLELTRALYTNPNVSVVVVSLDLPSDSLGLVRAFRAVGYERAIVVLCSRYALPKLEQLEESSVQGVVSSMGSLEELASSIYSLVDGHAEPLMQQYLLTVRTLNLGPAEGVLNEHERAMVQLLASDLTDQEISVRLGLSVRTINNNLHHIYAKLGVKGRAGAVASAIFKGLIGPPP